MKCMTWSRDTHGLFDYESNFITKKQLVANGAGKLVRVENDVDFVPHDSMTNKGKPLI